MRKFKGLMLCLLVLLVGFSFNSLDKNTIKVKAQTENKRMLKAVWVSPFVSDVSISSEASFKVSFNGVFDTLENYGYNALIFHVRIHNNALYPSNINPQSNYISNIDFNSFDPLEWLVNETHKRGMEFHAWLNPYRPAEGRFKGDMPSSNPESNNSNILATSSGNILDPSKYVVKAHIKNTVKEIIENYDVDAIHFDDYFYLPYNGLTEEQKISHVNDMVQMVHDEITTHNINNNKHVQFGISPTGIYKNGNGQVYYQNGKVVSNGSATTGQQHGKSYLCADTLHWMNEGWIDYIMPQIYWHRGNSAADFDIVLNWWNEVASYLDINLYIGLGLYRASEEWGQNNYELSEQLTLIENASIANGYSMYSYRRFNDTQQAITQMNNAYNAAKPERKNISVLPEIKSMTPIVPANVSHNHSNGTLVWNSSSDAKFYYLFRSTGTLSYSDDEIFKVVDKNTLTYYTGDNSNTYNYGVKVLSPTNHLSGQSVDDPVNTTYSITYNLNGGTFRGYNTKQEIIIAFLTDFYNFTKPTEDLTTFMHGAGNTSGFDGTWYNNQNYRNTLYQANVQTNNNGFFLSHSTYQAKWKPLADFMVDFVAVNPAQSFWQSRSTGTQRLWQYFRDVKPSNAWSDEIMNSVPTGLNQTVLNTYNKNSDTIILPEVEKQNNTFLGWYTNSNFQGSPVTSIEKGSTGDKVFYAKWEDNSPAIYYDVIFNLGYDGQILKTEIVKSGNTVNRPNNPERSGYNFLGWYYNDSLFDFANNINNNITLTAKWQEVNVQPEYVTVNFNLGYNNLTLTPQTIEKNSQVTKPNNPVRVGYTFNGWFLSGSVYDFNSPVNSNITLTANWLLEDEKHYFKVTFNYGYDNLTTTISVTENTKVNKPNNPLREGYEFLGWHFAGQLFDFNTNITYDIILIAQWKQVNTDIEYLKVTFNYNYDNKEVTENVVSGEKVNKPNNPLREGYEFLGWHFAGQLFDFNTNITYDIILIAQWKQVNTDIEYLKVTFNYNYDNKEVTENVVSGEKINKPIDPSRIGYTFNGWYFAGQLFDFNTKITYNITLIANWILEAEKHYFKVTFNYGYNNLTTTISVTENTKVNKPNNPSRVGYEFLGWYLDGVLYNFNLVVNQDIILNAMWEEVIKPVKEITVTFKLGYDNKTYKETIIKENEKVETPFTPYRAGYIFNGWYLNEEKYNFNELVTENITLIADWEEVNNVKDVSIFGKTDLRVENNNKLNGLMFYGIKNKDYETEEHGFYLVYGRTTNSELKNAINNNLFINNKKVFKVVVNGLLENKTFRVVIKGIPEDSYDDVITVVPYVLIAGELVLSKEAKISSVNHTINQNNNITLNFEIPLFFKKRKSLF